MYLSIYNIFIVYLVYSKYECNMRFESLKPQHSLYNTEQYTSKIVVPSFFCFKYLKYSKKLYEYNSFSSSWQSVITVSKNQMPENYIT